MILSYPNAKYLALRYEIRQLYLAISKVIVIFLI